MEIAEQHIKWSGRLNVRILFLLSFVLVLFVGFQGGIYFLKNRIQEVAILILALFYTGLLLRSLFLDRKPQSKYPLVLIAVFYLIVVPPLIFQLRTGASATPSILASRPFAYLLLIPTIIFALREGLQKEELQTAVYAAFLLVLLNYIFCLNFLDLKGFYFSADTYYSSLVVHDEWRGYRLRGPTYIMVLQALVSFRAISRSRRPSELGYHLFTLLLSCYLLFLVQSRLLMLATGMAFGLYIVFLRRPRSTALLMTFMPLVILGIAISTPLVSEYLNEKNKDDWSYKVRAASFDKAFTIISKHPFFGYGQASYHSISYQQLFGRQFAPSDLGMTGVIFKYGVFIAVLYIILSIELIRKLLLAHWKAKSMGEQDHLLWGLLILHSGLLLASVLQPAYAYPMGMTLFSLGWIYQSMYLRKQYRVTGDLKGVPAA